MPRVKLTDKSVRQLRWGTNEAGEPIARRWPDHGLGSVRGLHVLVQPSGTRTYCVNLARNRSMKLGRVETMKLAEARDKAGDAIFLASRGGNPRTGAGGPKTFEGLVKEWSEYKLKVKRCVPGSVKRMETFMLSSCDGWCTMKPAAIKPLHVREVLDEKVEHSPSAADLLHKNLCAMFRWAYEHKEWLPENPTRSVTSPWDATRHERRRKRLWFRGERADTVLKALWKYADDIGLPWSRFIKLAIITGKRINAVEDMRWEHIDADWYWEPPSRSRNKRNNPIPLPKLAQEILSPREATGKVMTRVGTSICRLVPGFAKACRKTSSGMGSGTS